MSDKDDLKLHEKFAKQGFNKTWDLLEKKDRTPEEDTEMVHTVHASRHHWGVLVANGQGTPLNLQRGEWQIARVYTVLEREEPALYHANLCLKLTQDNDIGDFDLGFAYEAMARASALAGNKKEKDKYLKLAKEAGEKIKDKGDKDYFLGDLNGGKWFE
ncbi:MAG: hypothetical protein ACXABG_09105 [Promethearchaeota archaeon]|jgi:hypothetical protein